MNKIKEKITELESVYTGSIFKLKIKAIRYATYEELKAKTYEQAKDFSYSSLKGE